jgi:hypothetical protein
MNGLSAELKYGVGPRKVGAATAELASHRATLARTEIVISIGLCNIRLVIEYRALRIICFSANHLAVQPGPTTTSGG